MLSTSRHNVTTVVNLLTVRKNALEAFRTLETHAAVVMSDYGGRIERTVFVEPENQPDVAIEVHILTFPSAAAYASYRRDGRLTQLENLRRQAVVRSDVYAGEDGPDYFVPPMRSSSKPAKTSPSGADKAPATPDPGLSFAVQKAVRENRKLEAIRLLSEERGLALMDAKRIVDAQIAAHRQTYGPPPPKMDSGLGRLLWLVLALAVVFALFWLLG